MFASLADLQTF